MFCTFISGTVGKPVFTEARSQINDGSRIQPGGQSNCTNRSQGLLFEVLQ